jgi:lysophospholipase L1-like esterase
MKDSTGRKLDSFAVADNVNPNFTGTPTVDGVLLNPNATPFPYWRRALAKVLLGQSDAKILCWGDSTTVGYVAPANTYPTSAIESYPADVASILNSRVATSFIGLGIPSSGTSSTDARWSLGTGWAADLGAGIGWSSNQLYKGVSATGALTYTPGVKSGVVDRFDVYYIANGTNTTFTITATGGSAISVVTGTQNGIFKATCSAGSAADTNSVSITMTTGTVRIVGVEPYSSTTRRIRVGNAGVSGAVGTTAANTAVYATVEHVKAYAPDLTIVSFGLNDASTPKTAAEFEAAMRVWVDTAKLSGDVILMSPPPPQVGGNLDAGLALYRPIYAKVAAEKKVGFVDLGKRWVSRESLAPLGYYSDTLHPSRIGYNDIAQAVTNLIRSI